MNIKTRRTKKQVNVENQAINLPCKKVRSRMVGVFSIVMEREAKRVNNSLQLLCNGNRKI